MTAAPKFARYITAGDRIPHPTRGTLGVVASVHWVSPTETPGRPYGVMSGWMVNPADPRVQWAWTYPADSLVLTVS